MSSNVLLITGLFFYFAVIPVATAQVTLSNVTLYTDSANYTVPAGETITLNKLRINTDDIQLRKTAWEEFRKIDFNRTGSSATYIIHIQDVEETFWQFNITSTVADAFTEITSSRPREIRIDGTESSPINFTHFLTTVDMGDNRTLRVIYLPSAITADPVGNFTFPIATDPISEENPDLTDFLFERTDINATYTQLNVTYPDHYDTSCTFYYNLGQVTDTYSSLTAVDIGNKKVEASFEFNNPEREVIDITCVDEHTNHTSRYIITQSNFQLLSLIESFRSGEFGTLGMFGAIDFVTWGVLILSMIGFNRVNETAGVLIAVMVTGVAAFFGIIAFPTIIFGAIAVILMVTIISTRKVG